MTLCASSVTVPPDIFLETREKRTAPRPSPFHSAGQRGVPHACLQPAANGVMFDLSSLMMFCAVLAMGNFYSTYRVGSTNFLRRKIGPPLAFGAPQKPGWDRVNAVRRSIELPPFPSFFNDRLTNSDLPFFL